jgi:hypothetical protein
MSWVEAASIPEVFLTGEWDEIMLLLEALLASKILNIFVNQLSKHSSLSVSLKKMTMFLYMQALLVLAWQLFK